MIIIKTYQGKGGKNCFSEKKAAQSRKMVYTIGTEII